MKFEYYNYRERSSSELNANLLDKAETIFNTLESIYKSIKSDEDKQNQLIVDDRYIDFSKIINELQKKIKIPKNFLELMIASRVLCFAPKYSIEDFEELKIYANKICKNFKYLVVIGMGGAILIPMAIMDFIRNNRQEENAKSLKVFYISELNTNKLSEIEEQIDLNETIFLTISKSGETSETLCLIEYWVEKLNHKIRNDQLIFITSKKYSILNKFATELNAKIFFHPEDIKGRFGPFSIVGILSVMLCGGDAEEFCKGGCQALEDFYKNGVYGQDFKSAFFVMDNINANRRINVLLSYNYFLSSCFSWYNQLYSENLGKNKNSVTVINAIGPQEQHTNMQAFIDGYDDKFYTMLDFISAEKIKPKGTTKGTKDKIEKLNNICYELTLDTLGKSGKNIERIDCKDRSLKTFGELLMKIMIRTTIVPLLMDINPYIQPSVDKIKSLVAKEYL